jgi:hypothetical protein
MLLQIADATLLSPVIVLLSSVQTQASAILLPSLSNLPVKVFDCCSELLSRLLLSSMIVLLSSVSL